MTSRLLAITLAVSASLLANPVAGQKQPVEAGLDLVELDVVVLDGDGRAVSGLTKQDFQIKEDGKNVEIKTFDAMSIDDNERIEGRPIVLLLDDSGLGPGNTLAVQAIARTFVSRMGRADEFSVVRLNNRRDEAFGDRLEALTRIAEYRSDTLPFFGRETLENALNMFTKVSRTVSLIEHRRKALVCIGLSNVCNVPEPASRQSSLLWKFWRDAVGAMAKANVSLYAVEPIGISTRIGVTAGTMADATGGDVFRNATDLARAIEIVRRDISSYYLLGYWPPSVSGARDLHSIEVKTGKRGLRVRARRYRGL